MSFGRFDPDYDYRASQHYRTRAIGQLVTGPIKAVGYDNKVMRLTREDIDFENPKDAMQFVEYHRRKYAPIGMLSDARRLKMVSQRDQ